MDLKKYLEMTQQTEEKFQENLKDQALKRIRLNLGIKELIQQKIVKLDKDEIKKATKDIDKTEKKEQILSEKLFQKTLDYLFTLANKNA